MTPPNAPPRQNGVITVDPDVGALEAALDRGWAHLHFDPPLERRYECTTGQARTRRHIYCNVLGLASFWLLSSVDVDLHDGAGLPLALIRLGVVWACVLGIALLWWGRRSISGAPRESLTALGTVLIAGYAATAAHEIGNIKALMQGSGLLLIFLHAGIGARLQFRFAIAVNSVSYLGYALAARSGGPDTAPVLHNHLLLFGVVVVFATAGNYLLEFRERRNYLLACLKDKRHAALLADAEALRELSVRDGLTKLFNRRRFDAELAQAWSVGHRDARPVALLQVDVDDFKRYNDRYGHPAGDRCLVELAAVMGAVADRHGGLAARIGGEEFALLLPRHDDEQAAAIAAEACDAVRALAMPHADSQCARTVTVSIGSAAIVPGPGRWASTLIGAADAALYAAKSAGRNGFVRFEERLAPSDTPRVRRSHEPLASDADADAPADDLVRIDRFSGLLVRGLHWLRFPADIETEFQEVGATERWRQIAFLIVGGLTSTLIYTALCRPVIPDIADTLLQNLVMLSLGACAVTAVGLKLALNWRLREGLFAGMVSVFAIVIVAIEATSTAPTVYSATLALSLLPMFSALIAAQPLRFSIVPSLVVCLAVGLLMSPEGHQRHDAWLYALALICCATTYSLVGGYLLELSKRRAYLLDRLRLAQLAVLRHNTRHLQRLATLDPLTALPNRRHFDTELDRLGAACHAAGKPLALLILDIDHFKSFNDGYGHPAGDACLQRIGAALLQWTRSDAPTPLAEAVALPAGIGAPMPARIGGEEFGVLLPGCDASTALGAAQRLRLLLRDLRIDHAHSPAGRFVTVSVGAASLALDNGTDARRLLKAADDALYRAKHLGRDQAAA